MIGQLTDGEFVEKLSISGGNVDYITKKAVIRYGKYTYNYYVQHSDGSWTNTECKTIYR